MKEIPIPKVVHELNDLVDKYSNKGDKLSDQQLGDIRAEISTCVFHITRVGGFLDQLHKRAALMEIWAEKQKATAYRLSLENESKGSSTKADKLYREDKKFLAAYHSYLKAKNTRDLVRDNIKAATQVLNSIATKLQS